MFGIRVKHPKWFALEFNSSGAYGSFIRAVFTQSEEVSLHPNIIATITAVTVYHLKASKT